MDNIIFTQLNSIETAASSILRSLAIINGYTAGMNTAALSLIGNGFDNQQPISLSEEIKQMIVELKIKGSVRERSNGLIELRTQALGSIYGRTREEIETKLNQRLKENKQKSKIKKDKALPLSEFFYSQYLPYKKNEIKESQQKSYLIYIRRIVREGFDMPLDKYKSADIEKYLLAIPQTRTRQMIRGVFNNIFTYAKRIGAIKVNPCDNVEQVKHKKKSGKALSFDDQYKFFELLTALPNESEKNYLLFVYLTGTRRSEAQSLTTADIDFNKKMLHIPGTKTEGSNRLMPLTPLIEKLLQSIEPTLDGRYFPLATTRPDQLMEKLTDAKYHLHDLRHTFGTIKICVDKLDAKTVSLWMGHSTVAMTLTTYTHPEQLNTTLFYDGSKTEEEKLAILREQYSEVIKQINDIIQ